MKILFMGTPGIAETCFRALAASGHEIVGAVTQPDRPKGRGYEMVPPPVKLAAGDLGIPVYQPATLRDESFAELLRELDPELIAVVAFGKLLPPSVLDYPKYGCINVHASLLPEYRGAAPIQRAIMDGKTKTGITTMYMAEGLDTGDMLLVREVEITPEDNGGSLTEKLAEVGAALLCETVDRLERGDIERIPQDDSRSTYAAKILKTDCRIDFTKTATEISNLVRALAPTPYAVTRTPDGKLLKIVSATPALGDGACGEVIACPTEGGCIRVACGEGSALDVSEVIPEGKGKMKSADFIRGRKIKAGDILA